MAEPLYRLSGKRVFVAGHRGMVGSAIVRRLQREGCAILTASRAELDLTRQSEVEEWMGRTRPDAVVVAAAKVGGILANSAAPADFLYDNVVLETNIISSAQRVGVGRLLFLGSSCIYPRDALQPIVEDALLTGPLEPTNEAYAIAKIAGIKLCAAYRRQYGCDFISAMPTSLYGPGDNFDLASSHVVPALIRKVHEAKASGAPEVCIWGSGSALREFLHVDDCAEACVHLLKHYSGDMHVNIGSGEEIAIRDLAQLICRLAGYSGGLRYDTEKPDGVARKLLDSGRLRALGWSPSISLSDGLGATYAAYVAGLSMRREDAAA
ncbi:GDP-L-fucose synthase [Sinorhizobium sp. BG8]|uniref:GDP-L-fucose synthase family protein n=1 Tax=Sinorhizobium sp. BG8 TaxID=2613773 RepID=UPI001AF4503E|nr:GDP-L-fucose synthase [Sinorhizobium sp. BG8]QRM56458.1 GDP-L-fucose synthase [Sinorhizobium sp. BG8]